MNAWLPWVLPPLIGAMIGYVTNAVAIRMLFRPFREVRLLGVRLPFTPGVIPRQRADLAERIGRMVARQLLTPEVFDSRFASESFGRSLQRAAVTGVDYLAGMPVSRLAETTLPERLLPLLLEHAVAPMLRRGGSSGEEVARSLRHVMGELRPLELVQPGQVATLAGTVWPGVERQVEQIIRSPGVRSELHVRARRILRFTLDQLTSIQRLFVSAAQYDRQLEARLPAIIDRTTTEILQALQEPRTRAGMITWAESWIEEHRDQPLEALLGNPGMDMLETVVARSAGDPRLAEWIAGERSQAALSEWVRAAVARNGDRSLAEMMPVLVRRRANIGRWIAGRSQAALVRASGQFLEQLDVHRVVVDRINALDIREVEGLLLSIIKRHLQWINVFGALLGAMIGGVQILLTQF